MNQSWNLGIQEDYQRWDFPEKPALMSEEDWEAFLEELRKRFIRTQAGPDILRWGYYPKGDFSVKEAYSIRMTRNMELDDI